jgi:hypothetical protein
MSSNDNNNSSSSSTIAAASDPNQRQKRNGRRRDIKFMRVKDAHDLLDKERANGTFDQEDKTIQELQLLLGMSEARIKAYLSPNEKLFGYRFCRDKNYKEGPWSKEEDEQLVTWAIEHQGRGWDDRIVQGRVGYECWTRLKYLVQHSDVVRPAQIAYEEGLGFIFNGVPTRQRRQRRRQGKQKQEGKRLKLDQNGDDDDGSDDDNDDAMPQQRMMMVMTNAHRSSYHQVVAPAMDTIRDWFNEWMMMEEPPSTTTSSSSHQPQTKADTIVVSSSIAPVDMAAIRQSLSVMNEFDKVMGEAYSGGKE